MRKYHSAVCSGHSYCGLAVSTGVAVLDVCQVVICRIGISISLFKMCIIILFFSLICTLVYIVLIEIIYNIAEDSIKNVYLFRS